MKKINSACFCGQERKNKSREKIDKKANEFFCFNFFPVKNPIVQTDTLYLKPISTFNTILHIST